MKKIRTAFFGLAHPHCSALLRAIKNAPNDFEIIGFAEYPTPSPDPSTYESRRSTFAVKNNVKEYENYLDLIEKFGLTQEQVAKQVGKSRTAITNTLRLLDLPDEVLEMLKNSELSAGHARALLGLKDRDAVRSLAEKIIAKDLSVREVEVLVKKLNSAPVAEDDDENLLLDGVNHRKIYMKELERRVTDSLGRKTKIAYTPKKKVLEIAFDNDEDLEALLTAICGATFFAEN